MSIKSRNLNNDENTGPEYNMYYNNINDSEYQCQFSNPEVEVVGLNLTGVGKEVVNKLPLDCAGQDDSCVTATPEVDRRECFPWDGNSEEVCSGSGCKWCDETEETGVPWCFINEGACPSTIPESDRVDCHPEDDASRETCHDLGCAWCVVETVGIPWCFEDASVNQGGEFCPDDIVQSERIDCSPGAVVLSKEQCINKGCYFCESLYPGVPWCFTPKEHGYRIDGDPISTSKGFQVTLKRINYPSWFGRDITELKFVAEFQEDFRLRIKISDPNTQRYEVPKEVLDIPSPNIKASNPMYDVTLSNDPSFSFSVVRVETGAVVFDTALGGLQFSDQFIQLSSKLPSNNVYGFGETEHHSFRHDMNWKKWGMFSRDEPVAQTNIYGVHPYYNVLDENNHMTGVLILNSNAQEVEMTPAPGLIYRTTGGVIDLYFFLGPKPEDVTSQYLQAIGLPMMPPYWSLGFHLSRYGYNTLDGMKEAVDRMRQYDIPHDGQHGDIDYFDRYLDFTYDPVNFDGLPEYVKQLKTEGTKFITILDPPISIGERAGTYPPFDRGDEADVWTKESDGIVNAEAKAWPYDNVYFPDYWSSASRDWWYTECVDFHDVIEYDGLWLDMNEPASFVAGSVHSCYNKKENFPLYRPVSFYGDVLYDKTLCLDYLSVLGNHYNTHSLYGNGHAAASVLPSQATSGGRGLVISRSTFPGAGKHAGHWLGDNYADWTDMKYSITGSLEFNLFGIPYVGADICGFFGDSYETLCQRWMELGAFYTFSRNHNGLGWADHDPGIWQSVAEASKKALEVRYLLLPYLYTLFHNAHIQGGTVMRPLLHEFVDDPETHGIDEQFLWGPALLISPVLRPNVTSVTAYFPQGRWYDFRLGREEAVTGDYVTLDAPLDHIPVHIRGGYILPAQDPANSTMLSRQNPMGLQVALDEDLLANGSLFWDDGESLDTYSNGNYYYAEFSATQGELVSNILHNGYSESSNFTINAIRVLGGEQVFSLTVNGDEHTDWEQSSLTMELHVYNLGIPLSDEFQINWQ